MFRHILIPTDGSEAAERAARQAVELAKALGARVTALTVSPRLHVPSYGVASVEDAREEAMRAIEARTGSCVEVVRGYADERGVPCEMEHRMGDDAADAIVAAARELGCDAIAMGTRGHGGLVGLVLGSVAQRVLGRSPVPVVAWR
jgi:nucleotide-binding universal stress UspA family protein